MSLISPESVCNEAYSRYRSFTGSYQGAAGLKPENTCEIAPSSVYSN
uniref:Uncharacterized protein n=1 Tax=Anguilla anguilla TaxID=7936 RepID=A0A0E9UWP1_ANGAN